MFFLTELQSHMESWWGGEMLAGFFFQMVGTWVEELNFVEAKDPGKKAFETVSNWLSRLKEMKYSTENKSLKKWKV